MVTGTCDPASRGESFNSGELAVDGGNVSVAYRYGWDGVSVRESGCVGPLIEVTVRNNSSLVYYAHFKGRRGTWITLTLDVGTNRTYNAGQLSSRGFQDNTDLYDAFITQDPNPPAIG